MQPLTLHVTADPCTRPLTPARTFYLPCYCGSCSLTPTFSLACTQVFDKCFLGSTPSSTADVVFEGQLSAAYLFKEPLNAEVVGALHKLGPRYKVCWRVHSLSVMLFDEVCLLCSQSQFKFDAECDVALTSEERKASVFRY